MNIRISPRYRQSLQPFVEPELLEGVDYQPQLPKQTASKHNVVVNTGTKFSDRKLLMLWVATLLCLFSAVYNQKTKLYQPIPSLSPAALQTAPATP